jgi:two-component system sensor histidine kinase UhpB
MGSLSLKARLSWLIVLVLISTLLINISIQLVRAGPRVRAEAGSNLRLTRELVLTTIANLPEGGNPLPTLQRLYASLGSLRHVDIVILSADHEVPARWSEIRHDARHGVPEWFVRLVGVSPRVTTIPVLVGNMAYGRIAIVSNPFDELQEIWSDLTWLATISLGFGVAILVVVLVLVRFSLAPLVTLRAGLAALEAGRRGVLIAPRGALEFREISGALNSLASTLDRVKSENRKLVGELIALQDSERREIARDLHDEAGPCLFSIRAAAAALQQVVSQPVPQLARLRQISATMDKASETLQLLVRGLLGRLRPKGLVELGLEPALKALLASWELSHPDLTLRLISPHDLSSLDEAIASAVYRIVQEGVTNIVRHANADQGDVRLEFGWSTSAGAGDPDGSLQLNITIEDDGIGISAAGASATKAALAPTAESPSSGIGLLGMSERVQALGGTISIEKRPLGGTRIAVSLPLPEEEDVES